MKPIITFKTKLHVFLLLALAITHSTIIANEVSDSPPVDPKIKCEVPPNILVPCPRFIFEAKRAACPPVFVKTDKDQIILGYRVTNTCFFTREPGADVHKDTITCENLGFGNPTDANNECRIRKLENSGINNYLIMVSRQSCLDAYIKKCTEILSKLGAVELCCAPKLAPTIKVDPGV